MALKYNKKDFNTLKDRFYENPTINPITGHKIEINKITYKKLVDEFGNPKTLRTFNYFEQLPEDLQADIYNRDVLKKSPTISKTAYKVTKNKLCELTISKKEFINYINEFTPNIAYAIPYSSMYQMNITKFILINSPSNKTLNYLYMLYIIDLEKNIVTLMQTSSTNVNFEGLRESEYDLLTSYFIYKKRKTCQHIPNYAKNQILKLLKLKQKGENYIDLLSWYMYLRTNLSQFPYELPVNDYYNYIVTVDNKGNITMDDAKTIMLQLQSDCDELHQALLEQIQKL